MNVVASAMANGCGPDVESLLEPQAISAMGMSKPVERNMHASTAGMRKPNNVLPVSPEQREYGSACLLPPPSDRPISPSILDIGNIDEVGPDGSGGKNSWIFEPEH
jgi:hypothetical protein